MESATIYPYVLDPKLTTQVWGGDELVRVYGKHGDPQARLGESWECWDTDRVVNGALAGSSVADLRTKLGGELLGDLDPTKIFPVLTKIITAHDWLSVQVHPDDAYAQRVEHQAFGKTECWYVLDAQPNAEIVYGWTRDTSRAEYERRVADGTLGEILRHIELKKGDTVYIPHGMVHAIGPGLTVFETQQASDLTYRMFDYNRVGLDGKPRELHVQKAADVLDYRATTTGTLAQISYEFEGLQTNRAHRRPTFRGRANRRRQRAGYDGIAGTPADPDVARGAARSHRGRQARDADAVSNHADPGRRRVVHGRRDGRRGRAVYVRDAAGRPASCSLPACSPRGCQQDAIDAFMAQF